MQKNMFSSIPYVWALILFTTPALRAQVRGASRPFVDKEITCWDFHSQTIGDDYTLYVHVPPGYDTSKLSYPTLYITDGDWDKNDAINSFNMLRQDYPTTEAVVVGIGYGDRQNQRNRDLVPGKGAGNYLTFIEKEVIPFIAARYRVTEDRTLSGYSYGGLFATYALFNRPGLFSNVCIGAPGNSDQLVPMAQKYFAGHKELRTRIFLAVGAYEQGTVSNIAAFKEYLLKQEPGLDIETDVIPHSSHGAGKPPVIQEGVEFAFCKKHKAIAIPAADLEKYAGTYSLIGRPDSRLKFYVENGKLYGIENGPAVELVPCGKDQFFIYEDQKGDIAFKEDNGKMIEIWTQSGQPPLRFERVSP